MTAVREVSGLKRTFCTNHWGDEETCASYKVGAVVAVDVPEPVPCPVCAKPAAEPVDSGLTGVVEAYR